MRNSSTSSSRAAAAVVVVVVVVVVMVVVGRQVGIVVAEAVQAFSLSLLPRFDFHPYCHALSEILSKMYLPIISYRKIPVPSPFDLPKTILNNTFFHEYSHDSTSYFLSHSFCSVRVTIVLHLDSNFFNLLKII